jgi:hypothetical protein
MRQSFHSNLSSRNGNRHEWARLGHAQSVQALSVASAAKQSSRAKLGASTDQGGPHEPFTAIPNYSHPFCAARSAGSSGALRRCRYPGRERTQLRDDAGGLPAASGRCPLSRFLAQAPAPSRRCRLHVGRPAMRLRLAPRRPGIERVINDEAMSQHLVIVGAEVAQAH